MGTFNANINPTSTGLNLGTPSQRWNAYINNLNVAGQGLVTVPYQAIPVFDASQGSLFVITLTGNASPSIINLKSGVVYTFFVIQDLTGGWTFTWPGTVHGAMVIDPAVSTSSIQQFISVDGINLFPVSVGLSTT